MFVVIGSTTVDLFISGMDFMPRFEGDEFTTSSLVFCDRPLTMTLGGNGANSAYVLAALGSRVALCSAAGQDELGALVAGWLQAISVDLRGFLRSPDHGTPTTTAIMDASLNRISFHHPGPTDTYSLIHMPDSLFSDVSSLLITGFTLLSGMRAGGYERALRRAKSGGARTFLDIGPAIRVPASLDELAPYLDAVDFLITNEHELSVAAGTDDVNEGVRRLFAAGATTVILKLGKEGAVIHTLDAQHHVPGYPVSATVTIGAGDSFNAGLMFALERGDSLEHAVAFGNATASLVVASGRSVLGAPSVEQIEAMIAGK